MRKTGEVNLDGWWQNTLRVHLEIVNYTNMYGGWSMPFYKLLSFRFIDAKRWKNGIIQFGVFRVEKKRHEDRGIVTNHCYVALLSFHPEKKLQIKYGTNQLP